MGKKKSESDSMPKAEEGMVNVSKTRHADQSAYLITIRLTTAQQTQLSRLTGKPIDKLKIVVEDLTVLRDVIAHYDPGA